MKYNVGDRVRIKSIDWYNKNKDEDGNIVFSSQVTHFSWRENVRTLFTKDMSKFCGTVVTIETVWTVNYSIVEGTHRYYFTDEMIEGLEEEETNDCEKCGLTRNSTRCLFMDNCPHNKQKNIIEIPEGYVLKDENGNVINATKIVLEKKKKEYPKTFEECVRVLEGENRMSLEQMNTFRKLIDARNAYWKIAGEEMGLKTPWEPDWTYNGATKYCIGVSENEIQNFSSGVAQYILAFPTEEMRDTFKKNFDPDIKICKEFL